MSLKRNILIFHAGALGDFVLAWPLVMALGRVFAQSRVFVVTQRGKGELAERALRVESLDADAGGWHTLFADGGHASLPDVPRRLLAGAHAVASFVAQPDSPWAANVRAAAPGAELLCLAAHPPTGYAGHHTDHLVQQLAGQVIWQQGVLQMLASVRQRGLGMPGNPAGPVTIHPGSGGAAKCWPMERFVELASRLRAAGRGVRFVVGEVERDRWRPEQLAALSASAEVRSPNTLVELLELIRGSSVFVGNDSGPGHLAAFAGVPTVSLFGPTDPAVWSPIGPKVHVVRAATLDAISIDEVLAAIPT